MKVLIASSSLLAIPVCSEIDSSNNHQILAVMTNPDKPTGRGQKVEPNQFAQWAVQKSYPVYKPSKSSEIESTVGKLKPDLIITIAYGQLIKKAALGLPQYGWINIHFSILPKWRGASPVQHAILNGEKQTGVSIFKLDQGLDTGPVYSTQIIDIESNETTAVLLERLSIVGAQMSIQVLEMIKAGVQPIPQMESEVTYAPKLTKQDGKIQWHLPAVKIYNQFRALRDNPGIWCLFGEDRLKIDDLRITYLSNPLKPGQVLIEKEKLIVGAKDGAVELLKLTPSGRNTMAAAEFVRGLSLRDGLYFG